MPADPTPLIPTPTPRGGLTIPSIPELSTDAHPDSPKAPSPAWRGVLIKVPETAVLSDPRKPPMLRAFYRIPRNQWPKGKAFELIVMDSAGQGERRHALGAKEATPMIPPPVTPERAIDPKIAERIVIEGYLNINLPATISPPLVPGAYVMRLELGGLRSTDARIRLSL